VSAWVYAAKKKFKQQAAAVQGGDL
jgi:hypothetical protein